VQALPINKPASKFAGDGRKWGGLLVVLSVAGTAFAATFPLPIPTRAVNFPLSAPVDQGLRIFGWGENGSGQITIPVSASNVVAIAAGNDHSLALRADGTVVGWGYNGQGQTTIPASATNVVAIAAEYAHSLALRVDGTVVGWGDNFQGQSTIPASASNVVAIAAGGGHSLALMDDGTVVGWGYNGHGQSTIPASASNVVAIGAGTGHSLALRADGTVVAWGFNSSGQITIPASASNVVAIAAGDSHSLALRADGAVVAWGFNSYGQTTIPASASNVVGIAGGNSHSLALRADGTVVGWGGNYSHQTEIPPSATNVFTIAAGGNHSLALGRIAVSILNQPRGQRVLESNSVTLNVTATGLPLYFQWRKNGINIPGATGSNLVVSPVALGDAGVYSVVVSNVLGAVVSADASVVVLPFGAPVVRADGEDVLDNVTRAPSAELTMETQFAEGYIFYTLDGSAPSFSSAFYTGPFTVSNTVVVRALALSSDFSRMVEAPPVSVFVRPYTVQTASGGGGSVAVTPVQTYYAAGSLVTVMATPNIGWDFLRWEGDATGNNNPLELTVNRSLQVRAVFGTDILANVVGNGRIEISPGGPVDYGSSVELRAVPGPGQKFVAWGNAVLGTDNPRLFTVTQPSPTVAALFAAGPAGLPVIQLPASNRVVSAGSSFTLNATATGSEPLRYQWRLNGTPITGATNATLNIDRASETTAGFYELVVAGPAGTTVSERIPVMVTLFDVRPVLSLWGWPGAGYQVHYTDEVDGGPWLMLTNGVLTGERRDVIDFSSTNRVRRFYRALTVVVP
jgi:hypothetical protein